MNLNPKYVFHVSTILYATIFEFLSTDSIVLFTIILLGLGIRTFMDFDVLNYIIKWIVSSVTILFMTKYIVVSGKTKIGKLNIRYKKIIENYLNRSPNAVKFNKDLSKKIIGNSNKEISVLVFEIENINEIHRYLGYKTGNKASMFIEEMTKVFFDGYGVYSIFCNEISIILPDINEKEAYDLGKEFMAKFKKPVRINDSSMKVNMLCGIVNYPNHGSTSDEIFQNMGRTLTQSRIDHRTISIYDNGITEKLKNDYDIMNCIHDAIENNELRIEYHPKIDITENRIVGAEALLRWDNQSNINIIELIRVSENVGYITDISKAVVNIVINQMEEWQKKGLDIKVAINISPLDLLNDVFYDHLVERFKTSTVKPEMLELEITERNIYKDEERVVDLLNRIKNIGLEIAMDDFGTGYNSLKYISKFPFDIIKIDKYFIDNVEEYGTRVLIEGIINTANKTGRTVIAEGVETNEQVEILRNLGCDIIQGYYFSKPLKPESFEKYYDEYRRLSTIQWKKMG